MSRLPYSVTNNSLTFFVRGRPYSLHKDHINYAAARSHLLAAGADHDAELLIGLVDARKGLERDSFGAIQFDGDDILWRGKPLAGLWVDRILEHRDANEDFSHLWAALDKLVHNPTQSAIDRLPIFLERTGLGFLPDGRFLAFKGVNANFESAHASPDGTRFRHQVGDKPRMPREQVDPNPENTCSTGLHVGAPNYVRGHYSGATYALVLVAVDPVDVVSVPTDYSGEKMRVCGYEVIEHLDQSYSDELFGRIRSYTAPRLAPAPAPEPAPAPAPTPAAREFTGPELAELACVDDYVTIGSYIDETVGPGTYRVASVDELGGTSDSSTRVEVELDDGQLEWVYSGAIIKLTRDGVEIRPVDGVEPEDETSDYDQLKVGDVVEYEDGQGVITYARVNSLNPTQVLDIEGYLLDVDEDMFNRLVLEDEITASMVVTKGTLVQIQGHDFLQDGAYTIAGFKEDDNQVDGDSIFWAVLVDSRRLPIRNRNIVVANHEGEHLWPRTKTVVEGDTVTLTSLDGHDLRQDVVEASTPTVADEVDAYPPARAEPGDLIEIKQEGGWLPAGTYPVLVVFDWGYEVQTQFDGIQPVSNERVVSITRAGPKA